MTELPRSSPYRSTPQAPVSDVERDRLSNRLNSAYTDGALDADEYRDRLDRLFAAHTLGELVPVVEGLPPAPTFAQPAIVASGDGRPGELAPVRSGSSLTVVAVAGVGLLVALIAVLLVVLL